MIYVDTNVLIRYLMPPLTPQDKFMEERAHALLRRIHTGELQATTSETVLGELCWLLTSPKHFALETFRAIEILRALLNWSGWRFSPDDRNAYGLAFDIWERHPKLEFIDSLVAARAEPMGATLATFDRRLAKAYPGLVWE